MKILVLTNISVTWFYGYQSVKKYQWIFWHKIMMKEKLLKTHKNIKKNSKNDIKSNNEYFEVVLLKKLVFVWYNLSYSMIISCA